MLPSIMYIFFALLPSIYRPHNCWAGIPNIICGFQCRPNWVHCCDKRGSVVTLERLSLSSGFVVALSRQLLMLLYKSVCHEKVVKCHDICATPMSSTFVASLSRQCSLTFFFDDCCDKLFIVTTNFFCLLLCFIMKKL